MNNFSLGQKLKYYRTRARISQFELENMVGDSPGTLSRIENDLVNPTKETLNDFANALNLNPIERADLFNIQVPEVSPEFLNIVVEKVLSRMKQEYK